MDKSDRATSPTLLKRLTTPGDERSWKEFFELYGERISRKAHSILGLALPPGDQSVDSHRFIADICQETVLRVFLKLRDFDRQGPGSFRKWLDTIVHNLIVNELRSSKSRPANWTQASVNDLCEQIAAKRDEFEVISKAENDSKLVNIAFKWLEKNYSQEDCAIFRRLVRDGAKAAEVALEFNLNRSQVFVKKHLMMKDLREYMDRYLIDFMD